MNLDKDLQSIQEMRNLVIKAKEAQKRLATYSQTDIDSIVKSMADAGYKESERLAKMAIEETKLGVYKDKIIKNQFATKAVYNYIKNMKTVGIIREYPEDKVIEIASPVGVVVGIIPVTNPTSTTMFKALISIKSRNAIIFSPHPKAVKCINESAEIMHKSAISAGAPEGIIGCLTIPTMEATEELMKHPDTDIILATGGAGLVKSAYSAGKPAYGVGPGNVPVFIERSADVKKAVKYILIGKTFDNGTVCASEQSVIVDEPIKDEVIAEFKKNGAYFLSPSELTMLNKYLTSPTGGLNPEVVGQYPYIIAQRAGFNVPQTTTVLIGEIDGVGKKYPLSWEKLSPILAFYTAKDWISGCERCIEILNFSGAGHTVGIHSNNKDIIMEFGLKKPVFRIIVNSPTTHGAIGATTKLPPSLTLGCGSFGRNITSDNVSPIHLINIKRLAYGIVEPSTEPEGIKEGLKPSLQTIQNKTEVKIPEPPLHKISEDDIRRIVEEFTKERQRK